MAGVRVPGRRSFGDWRSLYERERERAEAAEARAEELRWAGGAGAVRSGIVEVAVGGVEAEAEGGDRGNAGGPPGGAGRLGVAARGGASARSASGGGGGGGEAQHGDGAADGGGAAAQGGVGAGEGARCARGRGAKPSQGPHRGGRGHPGAAAAVERDAGDPRRVVEAAGPAGPCRVAGGGGLGASLRAECFGGGDAELRKALRRSRRQKATIGSLTREKARLGKRVRVARRRIERLEARLAKLRASRSALPRGNSRGSCERQERPRSGRRRGRQPGAPGHGRTERPGLEERTEEHNPPSDARVCGGCGSPYAANGAEEPALVEIEVSAHRRVIRRPRWRRTCGCASSPAEVSAPPVPRLFARTPYGTSVWSRFLFERYACLRPLHRVCAWLSDQGLPVSPGTLADSVHRLAPLFEPVGAAILAHQNGAALRHADETSWRVRALREGDGSGYAWLWTSAGHGAVYFHVDPSRSAEAAMKLFDGAMCPTVLVCDRYSAYKKLARLLGGRVTLSFCWAHMRRDFIRCAAGHVHLDGWCREWLGRIATVYRLHKARLASSTTPASSARRRRSTRRTTR